MPSSTTTVLRALPPRSPRIPASDMKSPSQLVREKSLSNLHNNIVDDPSPQHLPPPMVGDADLAETRDLVDHDPSNHHHHHHGNRNGTITNSSNNTLSSSSQQQGIISLSNQGNNNNNAKGGAGIGGGGGGGIGRYHSNDDDDDENGHNINGSDQTIPSSLSATVFWRGKKVSSTDVASVGNASDTGIPIAVSTTKYNGSTIITTTTGRALHEKAKLALNAGKYNHALELFEAILDAQKKRFGKCHASVAAAMHNVGVCLQRMGQHGMAENLLADAVQTREKTLGRSDIEVAASLSKLGSVRISLGKFEEAFVDLRRALFIAKTNANNQKQLHEQQQQQQQQEMDNPATTITTMSSSMSGPTMNGSKTTTNTPLTIASTPSSSSDSAAIMSLATMSTGVTGSNKTVAQMLCHLACLYFEKGEYFAAQATFQEALDIYRQVWAATAANTTITITTTTTLEESDNNINNNNKTKNAVMLQLTDTLCNIGSVLNRRKCFAQAVGNFQEALDLQRGILEQDHPRIISTLDNLAYSYSKNKEYARAVTCYRTMLRAQVSQSKTFTQECLLTFRKRVMMYDKLKLTTEAINDTRDVLRLQKTSLSRDDPIMEETRKILEDLQNKKKKEERKKQQQQSQQQQQVPEQSVEC